MPAIKAAAKGDKLECEVCGLTVVVDESCGCVEAHELICCEQPMARRAARARAKPRPAAKAKAAARPRKK